MVRTSTRRSKDVALQRGAVRPWYIPRYAASHYLVRPCFHHGFPAQLEGGGHLLHARDGPGSRAFRPPPARRRRSRVPCRFERQTDADQAARCPPALRLLPRYGASHLYASAFAPRRLASIALHSVIVTLSSAYTTLPEFSNMRNML
jgi:hypothetical protein